MMVKNIELTKGAKAWVKRTNGPDEIVRIVLDTLNRLQHRLPSSLRCL